MIICDMTAADISMVAVIEKEIFSTPWSEKSFMDALNNKDNIYVVAKEGESVIGYVGLWMVAGEGQIDNVAVKSTHRNKGVCASMLGYAIEKAKSNGVNAFTLEVRAGNAPAIHLYEKIGFECAGVRKNYYTKPTEDAIIMWMYCDGATKEF